MVKLSTLVGIAGVGGMVTALAGYTLNGILQKRVLDSPVYRQTMKIINNNSEAEQLLGKPVKSKSIDIGNQNNIISLRLSTLELPVYGPKNNGMVYVWADRLSEEEPWNIFKMELKIQDELGGKVTIIDKSPVALKIEGSISNSPFFLAI